MRVCYLADAGSIHTQRWVGYFVDNGHEVHLISERSFGDNNVENVKLYVLKRVRPQIRIVSVFINLLFKIIQVRTLIKKIKPDVLHAHYITGWGLLGALSRFHPFVLTAWGSDVLVAPKKSKIVKWKVKCALGGADLITCDGENTRQEMIKLGADAKKIHLIFHGVDTKNFSPAQKDEILKEKLRISNSPVIISTRSLNPIYDVETLIESVPSILKQFPETKFIIVGDGAQKDYLEDMARSLEVWDSIRFIGQIAHNELPHYLTLADIYVSTSLSEGGTSVSTLEAMACGLPVVTTDVGDNRRWIEDGANGFIVPVKSPEILASKIMYLLENQDSRYKFARANRQKVGEQADCGKEMGKMEELCKQLIERYKR